MNKNTKIKISKGCTDYLVEEVERLRRQNKLLGAENKVMNNFFNLINRIGDQHRTGMAPDDLWQAKREIAEATEKAMAPAPKENGE